MTLVFVYNADSGIFNALADTAHKLLSPRTYACNLCAVTHSSLGMRRVWKSFLDTLDMPLLFLHRDEFPDRFPREEVELPAILLVTGEAVEVLIDAEGLAAVGTADELIHLLRERLGSAA